MSREKIIIVEDDQHISKLVKYNLQKAGFDCVVTITGEEALGLLEKETPDLMIVDIMLPKMDGFEFCRCVKQDEKFMHIPVIMLTARGEEVDRIVGFELGADDYIVKPFSPRELVLRIKAILRRGVAPEPVKEHLRVGNISVDVPRHKVMIDKKVIKLAPMEFNLLIILMERQGRVQSRDVLLNDVWGITADVTTRTVDTHIKMLRQKLGRSGKLIETVRGIGYRVAED